MALLLLGGTADGVFLAEQLHKKSINVIYSIAGLVRKPTLNCPVISGGFSAMGGLPRFIRDNNIDAILDVTHPYAKAMSVNAFNAAKQSGINYWRFDRKPWQAQQSDNWQTVDDWQQTLPYLREKDTVLLTIGTLDTAFVQCFPQHERQRQWARSAFKPDRVLPASMQWIEAIGPFVYEKEYELMKTLGIDVLVSKNSGGHLTFAKIQAARDLGIPVIMLSRPELPDADHIFYDRETCLDFICSRR